MPPLPPDELLVVFAGILGVLLLGTLAALVMALSARSPQARAAAYDVGSRVGAWWVMVILVVGSLWLGRRAVTVLFALVAFQAYREFVTITRTRRADQRGLFYAFFVLIPLQFLLVDSGWYGLFAIFIPVYAFIVFTIFATLKGDAERFLERSAKIVYGQMICVYFVSHIPALLYLDLQPGAPPGFDPAAGHLLVFLLVVSQLNDVLQYCWGKAIGRHRVAPHLSPNKTWEGLLGGVACATGIAAGLWWLTPGSPWQAALLGLTICALGFAGDIVMSAIKRDTGIKDYGHLLGGHGGVLDRIDGLCFSAPVFYHLVRYYFW